ncbi:restriction endonuclease subunit S [Campylobacter sp. 46490-21]|uniref:restriction endonuclease subunit S n=1 Tax=Campylobacter magnus TaxID=3026462 RepID=UPI0023620619|nr:restriction endonuclease subunit S [Campylobacter magnus]MDD0848765.1 restriction endonuclease subunit S [Campylobacter magnus]
MDNIKIRLNDFADIFSGFAFSTKNDMSDYGIPILKIGNIIGNGDISTETDSFYPHPISKKISKYFLKNNDFLVAMTGATIGKIGRIKVKDDSFLVNQRVAIVRAKNNVNSRFLYYFLSQKIFQKYIDNISNGSAQANISAENIGKFLIDNKILKISQNKIASILSAYDDLIEVNNKKIKTLNEMAQEIYKEWFVRFRFPGHEKAEFQNGIPKGWEIVKVKNFCKVFTGKKDVNQTIENGKYLFFSCSPEIFKSNDYIYDGKAIIIAGNGSYTGRTRFFEGKFDLYQRTYAIISDDNLFLEFLYFTFKNDFEKRFMGGTRGAAIPYIVMKDITEYKFLYNDKIIRDFVSFVIPINKKIQNLIQANENLKTQRDLLLPRLMSGKLEVKG